MFSIMRRSLLVLVALLPMWANAAPAVSAHQVVQGVTDRLLSDLEKNRETYRSNPQAFYDALNSIVGPVVDAEGISRSIMTVKYANRATPAQKRASRKTSSAA